jgi:hypothetical protein
MHSLTGSDHSSRSAEAKLFGIEFSYPHVSKEDPIKPRCDQLDSQLFDRNTSLMKTLFLCQLMSPLLFTRRRRRSFGYVNSGNLRGSRVELGE